MRAGTMANKWLIEPPRQAGSEDKHHAGLRIAQEALLGNAGPQLFARNS
jgi:hypothetical protein